MKRNKLQIIHSAHGVPRTLFVQRSLVPNFATSLLSLKRKRGVLFLVYTDDSLRTVDIR